MFYIDAHCDSVNPERFPPHLDFERMRVTECGIQFTACFAPGFASVCKMLDKLDGSGIRRVLSHGDVKPDGWKILYSVEGGDCLFDGTDTPLKRLEYLYNRGVRAMGLTWNNENPLSGGSLTPDSGLTALGASVIERMEELGMAVDLAHISERGFWDAMAVVKKPPIVSHTAAAALCRHNRNLTDEQIRTIAERGGVIGVCLYPEFLSAGKSVTVETVLRHIGHIRNTGGADCVGIGTDFDGIDSLPAGISGVEDMPKLLDFLDECAAGLNFARVLQDILHTASE